VPEDALKEKRANQTGEILDSCEEKKSRKKEQSQSVNQKHWNNTAESSQIRQGILPFAQLSLSFNDIKYSVDMPEVKIFSELCIATFLQLHTCIPKMPYPIVLFNTYRQ
jgi:hypothetical protein